MKKIFFTIATLTMLVGSFYTVSCSKITDFPIGDSKDPIGGGMGNALYEGMTVQYVDELIDTFARVLSRSLENVEFRTELKNQVELMFDNDYDVLYSSLATVELKKTGGTVSDLLATKYRTLYNESGEDFFHALHYNLPNLQISVPIHLDKWNPSSYRPYVIPLPIEFNDGEDVLVNGYDGDSVRISVSSKEEPKYPVIVISISERVDRNGNLLIDSKDSSVSLNGDNLPAPNHLYCEYTTAANAVRLRWPLVSGATGYAIYQTDDLGNDVLIGTTSATENIFNSTGLTASQTYQYMVRSFDNNGYSPYSNFAEITATNRKSGDPLRLKSFQFSDEGLYAVESYLKGAPEILLRIIKSDNTGDSTVILYSSRFDPSSRNAVTSAPYLCNELIFSSWTQSRYNDVIIFEWREIDNKFPVPVHITALYTIDNLRTLSGRVSVNASTEFTVSTNSDIARRDVCYWDPKEFNYGSLASGFVFNVDANINN